MGTGAFRVRVRLEGAVDPAWWSAYSEALVTTVVPDGTTRLDGILVDQGAVLGLLGAVRDLGLSLVSVAIEPEAADPGTG